MDADGRLDRRPHVKVLMVGGSGLVGTFVTPYLAANHELRVLDMAPPRHSGLVDYVPGSIADPDDVAGALEGMDTFVNMVMRNPQTGLSSDQDIPTIVNNYEVNTLGLHLLLWTAQRMGIKAGVHISTMSVHGRQRSWYASEEAVPLDNPSAYGLTKGLGERICQYFAATFGMRIIALRITAPRTRTDYIDERRKPIHPGYYATDEEDLANAIRAAIEVCMVGRSRFDAVFIAGDEGEAMHNLTKARNLLGWTPHSHRLLEDEGRPTPE